MSLRNRLHNSSNRFQTNVKKVLCICSAGLLRSPTLANVLHTQYGYNCRAAGIEDAFALVPVDEVLIEWADEIVCVEPSVHRRLGEKWPTVPADVIVLDLPDQYEWMDPELQAEALKQYKQKTSD